LLTVAMRGDVTTPRRC